MKVKLAIPKKPMWVDCRLNVGVADLLIGRLFVIDPKWNPTDAIQQPPKGLSGVFKVKKLSKRRNSAWFEYCQDDSWTMELVVPFTACAFLPLTGEIPSADDSFNTMLSAWADLWEEYVKAAEEATRSQEYKFERDEAQRGQIELLKQGEALFMAANCIVMEKDKKINELAGRVLESEQKLADLEDDEEEEMGPIQAKIQDIFYNWVCPAVCIVILLIVLFDIFRNMN